jgi:hypothetical protein
LVHDQQQSARKAVTAAYVAASNQLVSLPGTSLTDAELIEALAHLFDKRWDSFQKGIKRCLLASMQSSHAVNAGLEARRPGAFGAVSEVQQDAA